MAANFTLRINGIPVAQKLTNAEYARFLAYYQGVYTTRDAQGNPVVPTETQVITKLHQAMMDGFMQNLFRAEQETAATTAKNAIAAVVPTSDAPA